MRKKWGILYLGMNDHGDQRWGLRYYVGSRSPESFRVAMINLSFAVASYWCGVMNGEEKTKEAA